MRVSILALCIILLHVIAFHTPMTYRGLCDIAVFMNDFTLCVCESLVTWFARNIFDGNL